MQVNELLIEAKDKEASDLHLNVGIPPVLRINGKLTRLHLLAYQTSPMFFN